MPDPPPGSGPTALRSGPSGAWPGFPLPRPFYSLVLPGVPQPCCCSASWLPLPFLSLVLCRELRAVRLQLAPRNLQLEPALK